MVDAIAHVDIKPPRFPKQGVVAGRAAAMPVAGRVALRATCSAGRAKKLWGEELGERGDYGSGFVWKC